MNRRLFSSFILSVGILLGGCGDNQQISQHQKSDLASAQPATESDPSTQTDLEALSEPELEQGGLPDHNPIDTEEPAYIDLDIDAYGPNDAADYLSESQTEPEEVPGFFEDDFVYGDQPENNQVLLASAGPLTGLGTSPKSAQSWSHPALGNLGRVDHGARHLIEAGVIDAAPNSRLARESFRRIADPILTTPTTTFDHVLSRGKLPVKGYLGKVNGENIVIFLAKEARGKIGVGDIAGAWKPTSQQLAKYGIKGIGRPVAAATSFLSRSPKPIPIKGAGMMGGIGRAFKGMGKGLAVGCVIDGTVTALSGGNPVEGCIDGALMVTGARYIPIMEMDDGKILPHSHPSLKLEDKYGMGFRDSLFDTQSGEIINGPYKGKCLAVLDNYLTAIPCES